MFSTKVKVIVDIPSSSVDQFVASAAAAEYINLQGESAWISASFRDISERDAYYPNLDLSLTNPTMEPDELAKRLKLHLFSDLFLRPICADLLLGSDHPSRKMLERNYDSLRALALPAQLEFCPTDESSTFGPKQRTFYRYAQDLLDLTSNLIDSRIADIRNEHVIAELLDELAG